jgi:osmotically-inducible protein OsmY
VQRKDEAIKTDIVALLFWDGRVDAADIHVDTLEGLVTLSGRISQTGPRCFPGP